MQENLIYAMRCLIFLSKYIILISEIYLAYFFFNVPYRKSAFLWFHHTYFPHSRRISGPFGGFEAS